MLSIWISAIIWSVAMPVAVPSSTVDATPSEVYAKPQTLVAVEGRRRLNVYCEGTGSPTVLLDAGGGGSSYVWREVQQPLSAYTRVCAYDRAGVGFSDPTRHPSDVIHGVADLHRLIRSKEIGGPVIYVGHSLAGLYGLRLAADFPDDILGEVLIDPTIPGQFKKATAILPIAIKVNVLSSQRQEIARLRNCLKLARRHRLLTPRTEVERDCVATDDSLAPALRESLARQYATPAYQAASLSEVRSMVPGFWPGIDERQVLNAHPKFGDKPLTVLTAGRQSHAPGVTAAQAAQLELMGKQAHDRQAHLSQDGRSVMVPDSGHFIQVDKPDVVISEVVGVLKKVRERQRNLK